ncbi:MAG: DNA polymerase I [Phycisphaerae bacterium]|jgi:DNA polymerase-1|nr:DNA polymerase I [Phycisphaerae bacterium]
MSRRLYLIDGYAQFFRAYHAIRSGLTSPVTNEPTNLTFGFVAMMLKILRDEKPDYLAVVLDVSGDRGTFRSQIYPEYKSHRPPPPQDFSPQVERCLSLLPLFGVPTYGCEGMEADDVIATIVRRLRVSEPDLEIRIVSKDKDLGQLVDERVRLYDVHTGQSLGTEELFEKKGIKPSQVVDMLALMGDSVDNVPGVPGIGPKTAAQLITEFGSLEELLKRVHEVKGKKGEAIAASRETLALSRSLVELKDDCPVDFRLEATAVEGKKLHVPELLDTMRELGFNRHRDDLRTIAAAMGVAVASPSAGEGAAGIATPTTRPAARKAEAREDDGAGTLFGASPSWGGAGGGEASHTSLNLDGVHLPSGDYRVLRSAAEIQSALDAARATGLVAIDTETDGLTTRTAKLCGISLSWQVGHGVYIPLRSPDPAGHCAPQAVCDQVRPFLEDPSVRKVGHNLKFDLNIFRGAGLTVRGLAADSMIESYLVDSTRSSHGLDALAENMLGYRTMPISQVIGEGKGERTFDQAPLELAGPYAAEDADVTLRLHEALAPQIASMRLTTLHDEVELPLVEVLAELEWNGITVCPIELDRQRDGLSRRIEELRREISSLAPVPFNPDSPKQLAAVLFNKPSAEPPGLGLKPIKKTKTGFSTDVEVLEKLADDPDIETPLPGRIVEYRQLTKLVGTYLVALKDAILPSTGRVHASFHQTVTATGRLSSSDPNLQNIPIRTDVGREIRRAFVAQKGHLLLAADYSQIELRMLAHLSRDPALIEAFRQGMDIHTAVAAEVFGVDPPKVTGEMRTVAKMVNFGIVYGITAFGLARRLGGGTTRQRAQQIIDGYRARFSHIGAFLTACVERARAQGYVETILGRRRPTPQVHSQQPQERAFGERIAINTVVQGSAADLIKVAMVRLHRELPKKHPRAKMLLQIHDELVFEVPSEEITAVTQVVTEAMERAMELTVPLKVEVGTGPSWHDC